MHSFDDTIDLDDTPDKDTSIKISDLDLKLNNKSIKAGKVLTNKIISKNKG